MKLLKFKAEWCRPCHQQSKMLEGFKGAEVVEVDIEENDELTEKYSVRNIPTMVLCDDDGNELHRFVGLTTTEKISAVCESVANA